MSFFDSKKEVFDVIVTEYGRKLLSQGKFKPHFYSFFDDEIIYDINYASGSENQNDTQSRILDNSIYTKLFNPISRVQSDTILETDIIKRNNSLGLPIGTSDPNSIYSPSWNINVLKGNISSSYLYDSSSINNTLAYNKEYIPQINMEIQNTTINIITNPLQTPANFNSFILTPFYQNGRITAEINENILDFIEENTVDKKENFEVEIFEILENDQLKKLKFLKIADTVKNGILVDSLEPEDGYTEEQAATLPFSSLNEDFAESYFRVLFDDQIPFEQLKINRLDIYSSDINKLKPNKDNC